MNEIRIQLHKTDVGELVLGSYDDRLCLLGIADGDMGGEVNDTLKRRVNAEIIEQDDELIEETRRQIDDYLTGERSEFDIPLLMLGTEFQKGVWNALIQVPYGTTASYLQIARATGNEKAVRAVGNACKANPIGIIVPCHRVIGSDGRLVGYGGGLPLKERLLKLVSCQVNNGTNNSLCALCPTEDVSFLVEFVEIVLDSCYQISLGGEHPSPKCFGLEQTEQ